MNIELRSEIEEVIARDGYQGALGYFITCPDREEVAQLVQMMHMEAVAQRDAAGFDTWSPPSLDKLAHGARISGLRILGEHLAGRTQSGDLFALDRAVEHLLSGRFSCAWREYDNAIWRDLPPKHDTPRS